MSKLLRLFTKQFLWLGNILLASLLLCCNLIPVVNPAKIWPIGFIGLITPYIIVGNVFFVLVWLVFGKWRRALLSTICVIITWQIVSVGFGKNYFSNTPTKIAKRNTLSVMSYNVRLLNFYKWNKDVTTRDSLLSFLQQQNADILCMQEFFNSADSNGVQNIDAISRLCQYPYYATNKNFITKRGFFGDIIFSKYPITNNVSVQLDTTLNTHYFQYADVATNIDTFRVYNLHMQSFSFNSKDLEVSTIKNNNAQLQQSKVVVKKLASTYAKKGNQADLIATHITQSSYGTIICGDFNDLPSSYAYFKIKGNMQDAFLSKSTGLGRTYNNYSPTLRIDYIFYNNTLLQPISFTKHLVPYSDHYPIITTFISSKK